MASSRSKEKTGGGLRMGTLGHVDIEPIDNGWIVKYGLCLSDETRYFKTWRSAFVYLAKKLEVDFLGEKKG